jgi:glyoxylase-like metal-dependent hydrolase (beta-lactamase superfamily II)
MEKISANIYLIRGENDGRFPHSNSVLITDRVNVLIDVGCGLNKLKALIEEYPIDMVFYSHAHPDHCSGCGYFSSEIIWGPEGDRHRAGDLSLIAEKLLEPSLHDDYVAFITKTCGFKTFRPGHFFNGGEVFDFGTILMRAVYMPGHSYDHYCSYFPEERIIYGKYPYLKGPLRYWESQMIGKHLRRLMARDMVTEKDGRFAREFCLK